MWLGRVGGAPGERGRGAIKYTAEHPFAGARLFPKQPLKRTRPQKTFRGDVAVFDVGDEGWLNPCSLGLLDGLGELRFWAHDAIELLPDLA
jgi:hypothetical protein